ncbi:MAG: ATP-binding protein [Clostridiales bacterium]|nr:ATP-binding protein [Clostridiales bacterium]MDD7347334.1 ATP-binding protein [Clostridiales bacterium]MDY4060183.1 ATP-binding protein [Anaerovoracaceae bacterium]
MDKLSLKIPGKPEYIKGTRLFIGSVAANAGFDIEQCEDLKTAVAEACKNISCHGSDGFSDQYEVSCEVDTHQITVTVTDLCEQHSVEKVNKPCDNCPTEGNLSLFIIRSLVNDVHFGKNNDGFKYITMVKRNDC